MPKKETLFFTMDEALVALRMAFAQYPFQMNLLSSIWPLVFGDRAYVQQHSGNRSLWAKIPDQTKLIATDEENLKERILEHLQRFTLTPEKMAQLCTLVFGARVCAESVTQNGSPPGLWIDSDMANFVCIQCGQCCRKLNYREGCTLSDYQGWQAAGRTDILDWVGVVRENEQVAAYRIWMVPGTNTYSRTCPWLKKLPDQGRYDCSIHEVRPTVCRQYPGSRKHARLTGCKGVLK